MCIDKQNLLKLSNSRDWENINKNNFKGLTDNFFAVKLKGDYHDILEFISNQIKELQLRADYKELLQLLSIYIGKSIKDIKFKPPAERFIELDGCSK